MNVKKTKKFKDNCPENYHVHDTDIRALGNRDRNRGRMIGVVRHTLGRRDSC